MQKHTDIDDIYKLTDMLTGRSDAQARARAAPSNDRSAFVTLLADDLTTAARELNISSARILSPDVFALTPRQRNERTLLSPNVLSLTGDDESSLSVQKN
jgi:hypothetical protein